MTGLTTYQIVPPPGAATLSFHFGRQGIGLEEAGETLPSDSLFAALVAQAAMLGTAAPGADGAPAFARPFVDGAPPFTLSSLFPRLGALPLLPRPLLKLKVAEALRDTIGKGFKKLRYLSPALFATVCTGQEISKPPIIMQAGKVWISQAELAELAALKSWARSARDETEQAWQQRLSATPLWSIDSLPRVTVDRASSASAYYEVGRVTYAPEAGLALLVRFTDAASREGFERLLTLLAESGLGGRRSSGYGAFSWQRGPELALDLGAAGTRAVLLSRYLPAGDQELAALRSERSAYHLVRVGGWVYSLGRPSQRRQRVMMVAEGAVLDAGAAPAHGRVADVRPVYSPARPHPQLGSGPGTDHPVYRSGLALTVPIPDEEVR